MKITSFSAFPRLTSLVAVGLLALSSSPALADWQLDAETSHLSFGSIKKNTIGESNYFQNLSGKITEDGAVSLVIDLSSVESWVDIRNERLKEFLFQVTDFPTATLTGQLDMAQFKTLAVGAQQAVDANFDFTLHGQQQTLETELVVLRLSEDTVVVLPNELIFLDAEKFGLLSGLKKLQELAKLPSISSAVPVAFHLTFKHKP